MTLFEQVSEGIIAAMKSREKEKLEALRNLKKVMIEARSTKGAGSELTDEESLKIIQKLVKQRRESAAIYKENNRQELAEKETIEADVLEKYLPARMGDEELTLVVKAIIDRLGAKSLSEMGRVMGVATKELTGKADGKDISAKVKQLLG